MPNRQYSLIAREGWWFLLLLLVTAVAAQMNWGGEWPIVFWVLLIVATVYFRDPKRKVPPLPLAVVAPVDGIVTTIHECDDQFVDRKAICISIEKPWYNIISIRSPMEGKVQNQWLKQIPDESKSDAAQAEFSQWTQSDEADDIVIRLRPRFAANLIRWYVQCGERVGQGQRCGVFPFGLKIDVFLPENSMLEIKVGQRVRAGSDTIATLVH